MLLNYGNQKRLTGDYAASEALLERAVALLESAGESASRSLAGALNNLGLVYWRQGRERDAVDGLERALAIHAKDQGPRSGLRAMTCRSFARAPATWDELDIAERFGQEALASEETLYPPNHPFDWRHAVCLSATGPETWRSSEGAGALRTLDRELRRFPAPDRPGLAIRCATWRGCCGRRANTGRRCVSTSVPWPCDASVRRPPSLSRGELAGPGRGPGSPCPEDLSGRSRRLRTGLSTPSARAPTPTALSSPADSSFSAMCCASTAARARLCRPSKKRQRDLAQEASEQPKRSRDGSSIADLEAALAATRAAQS